MWIRSQDKQILINCNSVYMGADYNRGAYDIYSCANGSEWHVGRYSTREKAMKVMDDIQFSIAIHNYFDIDRKFANKFLKKHKTYYYFAVTNTFKMPQNNEVDA